MKDNILLILASGKSSRFGGYPKAFCDINHNSVVQNTVNHASNSYSKIYLALNKEIYIEHRTEVPNCIVFCIDTGHGDAHSLLRALYYIRLHEPILDRISICWGDAVFLNDTIFEITMRLSKKLKEDSVGTVICSNDSHPYAWFDVDNGFIRCAHFSKEEGFVRSGIHDQSIFVFDMSLIIEKLECYREYLGISEDSNIWDGKEMRLLDLFSFLYNTQSLMMQYHIVESGQVFSFNTKMELDMIKRKMSK